MASKKNLAKIHIAKKELGLTDEAYRDVLRNVTGKDSAGKINDHQADRVLRFFQSKGWKPKYQRKLPGVYSRPGDAQEGKIIALWIELYKANVIKNRSDRALQSFVSTVTKCDKLSWCTTQQKTNIIEALKDMGKREGVDLD